MYHTNLDWCTPSVTPLQKRLMSALRRDLVVFDCQPPSKIWRKSSPTVAMWLPCRYTLDSSDSGQYVTLVLLFDQLLLLATAAFIRDSILRMKWCRLVDFYTIQEMGGNTTPLVPLVQLVVDRHDFFIRFQGNLTRHLDINLEIFYVKDLTWHVHDFIPHSEAIPDDSLTIHEIQRLSANSGHFN